VRSRLDPPKPFVQTAQADTYYYRQARKEQSSMTSLQERPTSEGAPSLEETTVEKKGRKGLKIAAIAGISTVALAAAGFFVAKGIGENNSGPEVNPEPVATGEANPGIIDDEETPITPEAYTVESLQISSELSPEEAGANLNEILNEWSNAGIDETLFDRAMDSPSTPEDFAREIAQSNAQIFAVALFGPDWAADPRTVTMVDQFTNNNASSIQYRLITWQEENVFQASVELNNQTIIDVTDDHIVFEQNLTSINNADQNRIGSDYQPELVEWNGDQYTVKVELVRNGSAYNVALYEASV
jgi:hypothetical protein